MTKDTTTIRVEKDLRDKLKERRAYPKEKLENVIEREIGEKTDSEQSLSDVEQSIIGRIDDLETELKTQIERLQ